jgi:tRNA(Arg) A34 adenosine deaminase TadA
LLPSGALSKRASANQPFGALLVDADGNVVVESENTDVTWHDRTSPSADLRRREKWC